MVMLLISLGASARIHLLPGTHTADSLNACLAKAPTGADSINVLYNLYDIAPAAHADSIAAKIYKIARANGNDDVALDIIRDIAQRHTSDQKILLNLLHTLETRFPRSDLQQETIIYVKIYLAYLDTRLSPEKELKDKIVNVIDHYNARYSSDPYERLMQQFLQCIFISHETQGELLNQYLDVLERLLRAMPNQSIRLIARLYRQKAYSYTVNNDPVQAVAADRILLELYDKTERSAAAQGRPFRSLDNLRYSSLGRMLRNYPALAPNEADTIYSQMQSILADNPELAAHYKENLQAPIFLHMARREYDQALSLLKAYVPEVRDHIVRRQLLREMMTAAEATSDQVALMEASTAYSRSLEDYLNSKLSECFRELEIIYDVDNLQNQANADELAFRRQQGERQSLILKLVLVIGIILLILTLVFITLFSRSRTLSRRLTASNQRLRANHDELMRRTAELQEAIDEARLAESQKETFIKYIASTMLLPLRSMMLYSQKIIRSTNGEERSFLERFGEIIRDNTEALQRVATRLQHLSS